MSKQKCPCCNNPSLNELGRWETCDICKWEDDPLMTDNPDYKGGAMLMSLNEARQAYKEGQVIA